MTNNVLTKAFTPTEEDLEKIKSFTQRDFAPEELFIFKMVLCTNEADRDFDVFSPAALRDMQKLFIGKPGLRDHIAGTDYQTARIFDTYIEPGDGKGYDGSDLLCLKAKAYIPRCPETEGIITAIEAGIKREVSVSCAIGKSHCSVCGESAGCSHIPGKKYDGKICARVIDSVSDAYEWSFVAVPAQRYAGVTKAFKGGDDCNTGKNSEINENAENVENAESTENSKGAKGTRGTEHTNIEEKEQETPDATALKARLNAGTEVTLSAAEAKSLAGIMAENEGLQKLATAYTDALRKYALRLANAVPGADTKSLEGLLKGLNTHQLRQFTTALQGCDPTGSANGAKGANGECSKCNTKGERGDFSDYSENAASAERKQFKGAGQMPAPQLSPVKAESMDTKTLNEFKI